LVGKPKRFNVYDETVQNQRRIIENYGRERQARSIGSSFRAAALVPPISTTAISKTTTATFGLGDPIILHEENLGDVGAGTTNGNAINVDWSLANKFRCIVKGEVTFTFIGTPPNEGFVQQIIFEAKQDGTGGHDIAFADTFENDGIPLIGKEINEYNVWAFFASNRGTEPVFSFNTFQSTSLIIAMSDEQTPLSAASAASTITPSVTFRMPYTMIVTEVKASVTTSPTSSDVVVDIHEGGTTILGTKIHIDPTETTSKTGDPQPTITDNDLASDAEIEIFLDSRDASNTATGLKCTISGYVS